MPRPEQLRFDSYDVDLRSGEIRRSGSRVRLQEQPFIILSMLLEEPGAIVTRDQIRLRLWPDNSFGDFDHGINVAVKKLRDALADDPNSPRFIETVARRGYRFIAPVELHGVDQCLTRVAQQPPERSVVKAKGRYWVLILAPILLLCCVAALLWLRKPMPPVFYQPNAITSLRGAARKPAFSPAGDEVVFAWSGQRWTPSRLYIQPAGSSSARLLVDDPDPHREELLPRWWPDGQAIAYIRTLPNKPDEIWTVPRSGGTPRKLLTFSQVLGYDIAPDGKTLVVSESESPDQGASLKLLSIDGSSLESLTPPQRRPPSAAGPWQTGDVAPSFSADGTRVAFLRFDAKGGDLYIINVRHRDAERLTDDHSPIDGFAWMPDGESLILASKRGQSQVAVSSLMVWRLWLHDRRWEPVPITSQGFADPIVSRDGRRLAFAQLLVRVNGYRYDLRHPELEPSNLTHSNAVDIGPALSPDGSKITFGSCRTGAWQIFVANADGSSPIQLTSFFGPLAGSPAWSPDGKHIAFDYRPSGHSQLFVVDADGGAVRQLTFDNFENMLPHYSDDGRWIYFIHKRATGEDLWKIPAIGGEAELVMEGVFSRTVIQGGTLFYGKLFQRGIYARPLSGGPETRVVEDSNGMTFDVGRDGIYFVREPARAVGRFGVSPAVSVLGTDLPVQRGCLGDELWMYHFAGRRSARILRLAQPVCHGFNLSADNSSLLVTGTDPLQSDIMLIEHFR
jgi:Tol biopolymer transport system component/DNA-binding winged helix-turn-helix (wHTH) protein